MTSGSSSFVDFMGDYAPEYLPSNRSVPAGMTVEAPHGTTIVATTFPGGVVMAGDRRATMGNLIAQRDIEKVFPSDEFSCVGIAARRAWRSSSYGSSRSNSNTTRRSRLGALDGR